MPLQEPDSGSSGPPQLLRAMGRWDLTAGVANGVIGAGIFGLPGPLAALVGAASPLAYLFGGLGVFTIVLCFAEVASRFDEAGGPYLYARETLGPWAGFLVGWLHLSTRVLSGAAVLNIFADYLAQLVPEAAPTQGRALTLTGLVGVVTALNVIGVKQAAWAVNAFTIAKLAPLAALIVLGLPRVNAAALAAQPVASLDWPQAIVLVVFACGGFESALVPAGEAREPRRDMAVALIVAMGVVVAVYAGTQLVVVGVVPHVAASGGAPLAAAFGEILGRSGRLVAILAVLVSTFGWTMGFALQTPRILSSMAAGGELPRALGRIHPRFRTPHVAILSCSGAALVLALWGTFAWAATISVVTRLLVYLVACAALPILRARRPDETPGFRTLGGPVLAVAGGTFCCWLLATRSYGEAGWLVALAVSGMILRVGARTRALP